MELEKLVDYLEHQGLSDEEIDDFLEHFGVKGMKWGVRRTRIKENRARYKESLAKNKALQKEVGKMEGDAFVRYAANKKKVGKSAADKILDKELAAADAHWFKNVDKLPHQVVKDGTRRVRATNTAIALAPLALVLGTGALKIASAYNK